MSILSSQSQRSLAINAPNVYVRGAIHKHPHTGCMPMLRRQVKSCAPLLVFGWEQETVHDYRISGVQPLQIAICSNTIDNVLCVNRRLLLASRTVGTDLQHFGANALKHGRCIHHVALHWPSNLIPSEIEHLEQLPNVKRKFVHVMQESISHAGLGLSDFRLLHIPTGNHQLPAQHRRLTGARIHPRAKFIEANLAIAFGVHLF
mmetsp:Transcript_33406/g.76653  ORF Transcript_33406/g.76653 Transcript_33406/m.76653 type:complete len:204 (-) Transcript_33406:1762-2373(-)